MQNIADLPKIKEAFNKVVKYSQNLSGEVNSDKLFKDFKENKYEFYHFMFGDDLIKEFGEVTFHLSEEARARAVSNLLDQIEYIGKGKPNIYLDALFTFILENQDTFFDNVVADEYRVRDKDIIIPKGMKIIRAFKFFCEDKDLLNDIQSVASMAIQNDKITGTLCLSVHPLDFLSISENQHNWRSCHALDGEYRAGNLNYMADSTTMICYLKSKNDVILPRFPEDVPWNSKKWRVLLFFDEDRQFVMAGRQYPFSEDSVLLKVKEALEQIQDFDSESIKYSGWFNKYIDDYSMESAIEEEGRDNYYQIPLIGRYLPVNGRLMRLNKLVCNEEGTLQFNDLLDSSTYTKPYYCFRLHRRWNGTWVNIPSVSVSFPKIKIGKKCTCLECGKEDITMSESFLCKHCMLDEEQAEDNGVFDTCPFCGDRFIIDEGHYVYDQWNDEVLCCSYCYDNSHACEVCGEYYHESALFHGLCPSCSKTHKPDIW